VSEPFTITMFFTPEAASITEQANLPARAAYVVLRTAPLGAVPPAVAPSTTRVGEPLRNDSPPEGFSTTPAPSPPRAKPYATRQSR
jgi:hypothetical protein